MSFSLQYKVNINAFNVAINPLIMSPQQIIAVIIMQTCKNVLVQIYTSAYFDIGLLMKALEITWAKPMYMQHIFPCGSGMHLLIAGFACIGYLHGEADSENCHLNLSLSVVCDCIS